MDRNRFGESGEEVKMQPARRLTAGSNLRPLIVLALMATALLIGWRLSPSGRDASPRTSADQESIPNDLVMDGSGGTPAVPFLAIGSASGESVRNPGPDQVQGPGPGPGVVVGRLVDAVSGLPVIDAGVTLRDRGRRVISGPGGSFRFDGVDGREIALIIGPAEGYLPRGVTFEMRGDGVDLSLMALARAEPAVPIDPAYGGVVAGCGPTRLSLAVGALDAQRLVRVTCIEHASTLPIDPPPGRLPLAVVDLSPADAPLAKPADLVVALPSQPRFADGVTLDLFRFDLDLLGWLPAGALQVDRKGGTASGRVDALGTYLVAAPPFGAFDSEVGDQPTVTRYGIAAAADGAPVDLFPPETYVVFGVFDYQSMDNTPILVRTTDPQGNIVYESRRPYTGSGQDIVPMIAPSGPWPVGDFASTWYIGDPPQSVGHSIDWRVDARPTPAPTTTPPPQISPIMRAAMLEEVSEENAGQLAQLPPSYCTKPAYWFTYPIRLGETLTSIAQRTGTTTTVLVEANCLAAPTIFAGRTLWVPKPPSLNPAPYLPKPSVPTWNWPSAQPTLIPFVPGGFGSIVWPTKEPPPEATLAIRPTNPVPMPALPPSGPPDGSVEGGSGSGRSSGPPQAAPPQARPPQAPPPQAPSPVPPKDPAPSEPTLAPRPTAPLP